MVSMAKEQRMDVKTKALLEADKQIVRAMTTLKMARRAFHNSEQWYSEPWEIGGEQTYSDRIEDAFKAARDAITVGLE